MLAWDQALAGAHRSEPGSNVVLHECAHKPDMLDGVVDGTPVLAHDLRDDWVRVCTEGYDDLVAGVPRPPLRWYPGRPASTTGRTADTDLLTRGTKVPHSTPERVAQVCVERVEAPGVPPSCGVPPQHLLTGGLSSEQPCG